MVVYLLTIILIGVVIHFGVKGELWMGSRRKGCGQKRAVGVVYKKVTRTVSGWGERRTVGGVMDSTIHGGYNVNGWTRMQQVAI